MIIEQVKSSHLLSGSGEKWGLEHCFLSRSNWILVFVSNSSGQDISSLKLLVSFSSPKFYCSFPHRKFTSIPQIPSLILPNSVSRCVLFQEPLLSILPDFPRLKFINSKQRTWICESEIYWKSGTCQEADEEVMWLTPLTLTASS